MEVFQLVAEAFIRTPLLLLVPVALLGFMVWHPWSESKFYHVPEESLAREIAEPD